jgi:nucleotide-binding universal stress UspA family protein
MYRNILVPLDGSPFGEHALPLALGLARRAGAAVQVVHVASPVEMAYTESLFVTAEDLERRLQARLRAYLDAVVQRAEAAAAVRVTPALLEGDVTEQVRRRVAELPADLVVMTTHGRGPLGRFWLGSVADELLRRLPVPLLLVRPHEGEPDLGAGPPLEHLLVPLDGSPLAEQMLEPAVALGRLTAADYALLRVVEPVLPVAPGLGGVPGLTLEDKAQGLLERTRAVHRQLCREAQDYLNRVAGGLEARGLRVRTRVAVEEQPAVAILSEAVPPGIDAVALETHGRRGLSRLLLGSVADKVIRGAAVPVLVHRPAAG